MSVINKMLQDLDARQHGASAAGQLYTKPASASERGAPARLVAMAALAVALVSAAAVFGWLYWQKSHRPVAVAAPAPVKVAVVPAPPKSAPLPAAVPSAPVAEVASAAPAPVVAAPEPAPVVRQRAPVAKHPAAKRQAKGAAPVRKAAAETPAVQGKQETAAQKAESAYRRGLADLQEGYLNDGIGALEQALQANPRHDAARQTLVRVLVDNRRSEAAIALLREGLALDPRQPAMAMLLARLQIEHGGSGIDALMLTLPYAGNNSEYHAFLAGALQRQQRHREAVEQYQSALRSGAPNGVWLMGLGISLQAERRDADALDAFRKAKNSGTLSAELQAFVDSKIQQLAR